MRLRTFWVVILALAPCLASAGQGPRVLSIDGPPAPIAPSVISRDEAGRVTIRAISLAEPLTLDGRLDEPLYRQTEAITDFVQQEPREGRPATEKTEVWVAYDKDALYVGARLWESDPGRRVTADMLRDAGNLYDNDHFAVMLDTFYDHHNGYVFFANAQGGMSDLQVINENGNSDWNTVWETRAANFEGGWTIEFRVPFRSIRFQEGSRAWGINFRRLVRWKTEASFLIPMPASFARNALNRTSKAATLVGIEAPTSIRNIDVKAYAMGSSTTNRATSPAILNDGDGEFGVDVKWGVTQSYVADFTYNTDFAQVEGDEQQVNLTRYSLLFPEKREFFIDGATFFNFGVLGGRTNNPDLPQVFFSRRIGLENGGTVPIVAGARLLGRSGPYRVGVLQMRTGAVPELNAVTTDFSVVRVQREILRRSRVGMIATRRAPGSSGRTSNYVYGADSNFNLFDNIQITQFIAKSETPGRQGSAVSYRSRFLWAPDRWFVDLEHLYAGKAFNPEIGFHRRTDGFRRSHANLAFRPRPRNIPGVRQVAYSVDLEYFTEPSGPRVLNNDRQGMFRVDFNSGDSAQIDATRSYEAVDAAFLVTKNVRIPVGAYDSTQLRGSYTFGSQRNVSGTATARYGSFYDGTLHELTWRSRIKFLPQLYAEPTISWNHIDVLWGRGDNNLLSTRLTYAISPHMFVSALVQYQSRIDNVSTNARFRWEYRPGSELFIVYSDGRDTLTHGFGALQNRSFIVKATRLFQL